LRRTLPIVALLLAAAASGCASYTRVENAAADLSATLEGPLPQMRALEAEPLYSVRLAPAALSAFEFGRRFQHGLGGLPQRSDCALAYYDVAGRTYVQVKNIGRVGVTNYLGLPHARIAARRLRKSESAAQSAPVPECEAVINSARVQR